ncbi:MAG: TetR/AcrR family transcriptional regulator [Adlercreutzia equolifaciens]
MQSNKKSTRGVATREVLRSNDTAKRSAEIVVAARELYEEKGLARTSIQDITNHVGVTRSLFYHYFQNKEEVTSAVLDQYITDFLEAMQHWHESQTALATDESLHSMVKIMRMVLFEKNTFRMALSTQENAALYLDFLNRFAAQGAEFMVTHPMVEQTKYGEQSDHLYETFYVLIVGLVKLSALASGCGGRGAHRRRHPHAQHRAGRGGPRARLIRGSALLLVGRSAILPSCSGALRGRILRRAAVARRYGESVTICALRRLSAIILLVR